MEYAGDAEWEMFCRGRRDDSVDSFGMSRDVSGDVAVDEPVALEPGEDDGAAGPPGAAVRHFFSRVVGLPYPNPDGTSRREAVRGLRRWERVNLVHRPDNPVDSNAVAVLRAGDKRQLGYLPAALAAEVVAAAREGTRYLAVVNEVEAPAPDDLISVTPVRARLIVLELKQGATRAMARRHLLGVMNRR
jgi:hypothetical protein